jgi:hypothetical protein
MNENHNKMAGVSALPLIIILGLILGAGYFLLRGEIDLSSLLGDNSSLEMRRLDGFPTVVPVSVEHEKLQKVIKSEQELIDFLAAVDETNNLSVGEKINFDKEMLIGVATSNFDTSGYSMKIRKIYVDRDSNSLLVSSTITQPGDTCQKDPQLNVAVEIVAVDTTDMPVDFETLRTTEICE